MKNIIIAIALSTISFQANARLVEFNNGFNMPNLSMPNFGSRSDFNSLQNEANEMHRELDRMKANYEDAQYRQRMKDIRNNTWR